MREIFTGDYNHIDDCRRIQNILKKEGYTITLNECEELWEAYSDNYCAGWLILKDYKDEDILISIKHRLIDN